MGKMFFKIVSVICIFAILVSAVGCAPKGEITSCQDIEAIYKENEKLFNRTAEEFIAFDTELMQYIGGVNYLFEEGLVVAYQRNNEIKINLPDNVYDDMLDCFYCMDSIVNEEFEEDEYVLSMGYSTKIDERDVMAFLFCDEIIGVVYGLSYSKDGPPDSTSVKTIINENWYIVKWAGV